VGERILLSVGVSEIVKPVGMGRSFRRRRLASRLGPSRTRLLQRGRADQPPRGRRDKKAPNGSALSGSSVSHQLLA